MMKLSGICVALVLLCALPAAAAEGTANPTKEKLDARTKQIMEGLDKNQLRQFAAIRETHGTIKAVENVQASVKSAVASCSENNPDLKDQINSRFDNWRAAIRPTLKKAQSKLEKMILLQSYGKPSEVRGYLKLFDEAVASTQAGIKSVPIKDKAACEDLIDSMDDTEEDLIKLMTESLELDKDLKQKEL